MNNTVKIGAIYWIKTKSKFVHPHVIIKISDSIIKACQITTNRKKANIPGNIILNKGEGGLNKPSIVEVSKTIQVKISDLMEFIGELHSDRIAEINKGIDFIKKSFLNGN